MDAPAISSGQGFSDDLTLRNFPPLSESVAIRGGPASSGIAPVRRSKRDGFLSIMSGA
jgi:hypothetical protein